MSILANKAEIAIVDQIQRLKTNKTDFESILRQVDTMHQQIYHTSVLLSETMKLNIDGASGESQAAKNTKKIYMLE